MAPLIPQDAVKSGRSLRRNKTAPVSAPPVRRSHISHILWPVSRRADKGKIRRFSL